MKNFDSFDQESFISVYWVFISWTHMRSFITNKCPLLPAFGKNCLILANNETKVTS